MILSHKPDVFPFPANDPSEHVRRTCVSIVPVVTGDAVYGDPATNQADAGGPGEFLGIALAGAPIGQEFPVFVSGRLDWFNLGEEPVGTLFYQSTGDPKQLSTVVNSDRPEPIAEVTRYLIRAASPDHGELWSPRLLSIYGAES